MPRAAAGASGRPAWGTEQKGALADVCAQPSTCPLHSPAGPGLRGALPPTALNHTQLSHLLSSRFSSLALTQTIGIWGSQVGRDVAQSHVGRVIRTGHWGLDLDPWFPFPDTLGGRREGLRERCGLKCQGKGVPTPLGGKDQPLQPTPDLPCKQRAHVRSRRVTAVACVRVCVHAIV